MSRALQQLLHENGFRPLRQQKHLVSRYPSGRNFVTAKTPSDRRDEKNAHAGLRRLLRAQGAAL
jgi:hypothetical protein